MKLSAPGTRIQRTQVLIGSALLVVAFASCTTTPEPRQKMGALPPPSSRNNFVESREIVVVDGYVQASPSQQAIVDAGYAVADVGSVNVGSKSFTADCMGAVLAVYWRAGYNPAKFFSDYTGNGVSRLHGMAESRGLMYKQDLPFPGDMIIWDDTYDKNGDGRWGDPNTHAGVVVSVREDGQITYLHYNYVKGVELGQMNLMRPDVHRDPDGSLVNSPMRARADRHIRENAWLSSHLVKGFIPMYEYPGVQR